MSNEPYLSEIGVFAFAFAPRGWATCSGQILPIAQNTALFSLLGTMYGGNGQTTFALPDLRGRVPLGFMAEPVPDPPPAPPPPPSPYPLGATGGSETVALDVTNLPPHVHAIDATGLSATARCSHASANQRSPVGGVPAIEAAGVTATYSSAPPDAHMKSGGVGIVADVAGESQAHENRQPFLALTYCIALTGIFPSQNP